MTLNEKIQKSEELLIKVFEDADPSYVRVAWTGGKDSTVVLFLWRAVLSHMGDETLRAINLDTGVKFPEIINFRDKLVREWNIDLRVAKPRVDLKGYPVAGNPVTCCRDLKVEPLKKAIKETETTHLLTGIRRDEHPDRAERKAMEERNDPYHILVNPILDWTETDIWAFHARFDLPSCELYEKGYRSLGCRPCTAKPGQGEGERAGRDEAKEAAMETLTSLGYF